MQQWAAPSTTHVSAWIRVPVKHFNDQNRTRPGTFLSHLKRELRLRGKLGFIEALAQTLSETSNDRITRRTIADEQQAIEEAEKTFRLNRTAKSLATETVYSPGTLGSHLPGPSPKLQYRAYPS